MFILSSRGRASLLQSFLPKKKIPNIYILKFYYYFIFIILVKIIIIVFYIHKSRVGADIWDLGGQDWKKKKKKIEGQNLGIMYANAYS